MSSISSSESKPKARAATEILASRYRHLFVLPSSPLLLVYGGIASLFLTLLSRGTSGVVSFLQAFAVFVLSAMAISNALRIVDKKTIANFRRIMALLLAGEILWLIFVTVGATYAWATSSPYPLTNAMVYGAFVCAGLEFLIINGVFVRNSVVSLALGVLHPTSTLLMVRFSEIARHLDILATVFGIVSLAIIVAFPVLLKRRKTSLGHDALSLFQAFMRTWAAGYPDELEEIIADHSEEVEVTTKVLRFKTKAVDIFLVLPGVHPGPFHPVGSYDLPGVISQAFKGLGPVMTLHRPGGHERNLATRDETLRYATVVKELAQSVRPDDNRAIFRGPIYSQVGKANATASSFSNDLLLTISFAPLGSDDLETRVETELKRPASEAGFELSVIDAHNSIDKNIESPSTDDPGWERLFQAVKMAEVEHFDVAYSHSSELGFTGSGDLTDTGIGLFMIQAGNTKSTLILADANNAVPTLRGEVVRALGFAGYKLIEFCTSDSHNLAARGLTVERGYQALGEVTRPGSIAGLTVKLARLAEARLDRAEYGSAQANSKVKAFGSKALDEFAAITQSSSKFSRNYFRLSVFIVAALLLVSTMF